MTKTPATSPIETDADRVCGFLTNKFGVGSRETYNDLGFETWERERRNGTSHNLHVAFTRVNGKNTLIDVESLEHPRTGEILPLFAKTDVIGLMFELDGSLAEITRIDGSIEDYKSSSQPNPVEGWIKSGLVR